MDKLLHILVFIRTVEAIAPYLIIALAVIIVLLALIVGWLEVTFEERQEKRADKHYSEEEDKDDGC